jgi:hypothetical protein
MNLSINSKEVPASLHLKTNKIVEAIRVAKRKTYHLKMIAYLAKLFKKVELGGTKNHKLLPKSTKK